MKKELAALIARLRLHPIANVAEGAHANGCITFLSDAAQALRHVLVKIGSDTTHVAVTTAGTEIPVGVCDDEAAAAEDYINIQILGNKPGTILIAAHAAITQGDELVAAAAGRVQKLSGLGAATYYIIGIALTTVSAQDDLVEVQHCVPQKRVVS